MDSIWNCCINEARISYQQGDVPVGAAIVKDGVVLAFGHNTREFEHNIMGHAEINAILAASKLLKRWNLSDCNLYVTLEPCSMCANVIKQARLAHVYYLLAKPEFKNEYSKTTFEKDDNCIVTDKQMYASLLSSFFKEKR